MIVWLLTRANDPCEDDCIGVYSSETKAVEAGDQLVAHDLAIGSKAYAYFVQAWEVDGGNIKERYLLSSVRKLLG